jgi:DNA-binding HxlR family transcriptional regulator
MGTRTYGQHCGLAAAMDLVGQRWSMLIVRDLAPGPRRFTDLFEGLPGIATDVLAERLRELEAAGVVVHRSMKHPVPAKLYSLTESGQELSAIAGRLADWGMPLLPAVPSTDAKVRARWALQTMARHYAGGLDDGQYELVIDGEEFTVTVSRRAAMLRYGPAEGPALLCVRCSSRQFFNAVKDPSYFDSPRRSVEIDGGVSLASKVLRALPLTVAAA